MAILNDWHAVIADLHHCHSSANIQTAVAVPITSREELEAAMSQSLAKGETVDGITAFTAAGGQSIVVGFCDKHAIVAQTKPTCQAVLAKTYGPEGRSNAVYLEGGKRGIRHEPSSSSQINRSLAGAPGRRGGQCVHRDSHGLDI